MKTEEKSEKINRILGIISAVIGIVGSIFGIFQAQQAATLKNEVNSLQTASQQTIVNVVSTLGDDAKTSELTETGDMVAATDQLISVYSSTKTQNAQLTSEAQTLQSENEALKAQVENLKSVLLNTYSMDEVDKVVAQGYLDEVETKRLDNLEMLDSERCEQVSSVKDLYLPNNFLLVEHYLLPSPVRKRSCYRDLCVLLESGFLCFSPKPPVQSFSAIGILSVFFLPGPMVFA